MIYTLTITPFFIIFILFHCPWVSCCKGLSLWGAHAKSSTLMYWKQWQVTSNWCRRPDVLLGQAVLISKAFPGWFPRIVGLSLPLSLRRVRVESWPLVKQWVCLWTTPYTGWGWKSEPWWNCGSVCGPLPTQGEGGSPSHGETVGWSVDNSLHRAWVKSHTLGETVGLSVDVGPLVKQWVCLWTTPCAGQGWKVIPLLKQWACLWTSDPWWNSGSVCGPLPTQHCTVEF